MKLTVDRLNLAQPVPVINPALQTIKGRNGWVHLYTYFAGRVDDENKHEGDAFSTTLAEKGYTIEIIAKDGYSVSLDSIRVMDNPNYIVAFTMNGNVLDEKGFPLQLVGPDLQKNEKIGGIAKIVLHMDEGTAAVEATAEPTVESKASRRHCWCCSFFCRFGGPTPGVEL